MWKSRSRRIGRAARRLSSRVEGGGVSIHPRPKAGGAIDQSSSCLRRFRFKPPLARRPRGTIHQQLRRRGWPWDCADQPTPIETKLAPREWERTTDQVTVRRRTRAAWIGTRGTECRMSESTTRPKPLRQGDSGVSRQTLPVPDRGDVSDPFRILRRHSFLCRKSSRSRDLATRHCPWTTRAFRVVGRRSPTVSALP